MKKIYSLAFLLLLLAINSKGQTTLLNEGFESATFPPAGWKMTNAGAGSTWTRNTTANLSLAGTASLRCARNATQPNNAWMFTPKIALNTNPCTITFWARVRTAGDTAALKFTVGSDTTIASQVTVLADSVNVIASTYALWTITYTPTTAGNYNFAFNCYSTVRSATGQGLYIDSVKITQPQNVCSGTPVGGTINSSTNLVCPSASYTLSVSGMPAGVNGFVYQWQSSSDSINWADMTNDTTEAITKTGLTATAYFRRKTICTNGGAFAYSTVTKIVLNSLLNCYCGPSTGVILNTGTTGASIDTIKITNTNLNHLSTGIATGGYSLFSDSTVVPTAYLQPALTYKLYVGLTTVTTPIPQNGIASVWIDWNHNGNFDTTEYYRAVTNAQNGTLNITVPANAVLGATMMRIRSKNNTGGGLANTNACTVYTNGETEDYVIYVVPTTMCTGTPVGGFTQSNSNPVCANTSFILAVSGATSGIGGLSYQWQSSTDNINWSDITGATNLNDTVTAGIAAQTYFRRKIICGGGGFSYSTVDTIRLNAAINCYCGPSTSVTLNTGTTGASIDTVSITGSTWVGNITTGIAPYKLYNDSSVLAFPKLQQAATYSLSVGLTTVTTPVPQNGIASAWFDWNQNGKLDSLEYVRVITNGQRGTVSFTVPVNAPLGNTLMRIRSKNNTGAGLTANTACTSYANGETEDYVITILPGNSCNGTPNPGTAYANIKAICPNTAFNIFDTGSTSGVTGLTYLWQTSTDSLNWINTTVTTQNYLGATITGKTFFRRATYCGSNVAYSNGVAIAVYSANICAYCSPLSGTTLHTGTLPSVDSVTIVGTALTSASTGENAVGYFLDTAKPIPSLYQTLTYNQRIRISANGLAGMWIDWDGNKVFDTTEYIALTIAGTTATASFTVPVTGTVGKTLLRVRTRAAGPGSSITNAMSCTSFTTGETEDYVVNVLPAPSCLPPTNATVNTITSSSAIVHWVAATTAPSNGYSVYINTTNNQATATLSASNVTIDSVTISNLNPITTYYVWIVANCGATTSPALTTTFTSACGVVTSLPLIEGFESIATVGIGAMPTCWTATTTTGGTRTNFTSSQTTSRNGIGAKSGTKFIYTRRANSDWLISPAVQLTAGTQYYLVYNYRPTDPNQGITINAFASTASDTTTLLTSPIGTSIVNPVDSSKYTQSVNSFTPSVTGIYHFAIQCINVATTAANNNLNLDDIIITNTLFTLSPTITSFNPTRASTGNTITIKGANFTSTTAVKFGARTAASYTVINDSTVNAIVGNGASGFIKVSNAAGTDSLPGFIYCPAATIKNINITGCDSTVFNGNTYTINTTVRDTVRSTQGCDSIYNVTNIVITKAPVLTNVSSNSPLYSGDTIKLNVDTTFATALNWTGPNSFTSALKNPKIIGATVGMSGWYYITAINGSCISKDSINVTVKNALVSISGRVITPLGKLINNAVCTLAGTATNSTSSNSGLYTFSNLNIGSYTIKPKKNNDITKANGVTSVDVLLTQRHILNTAKLTSPYKIIAADVTGDKQINSTDVLRMKRLILGTDTTFTSATRGSRLWEFIDSTYTFPDTTNSFPYKDSIILDNITNNKTNQSFIGVKLGDVNYDWNPAVARGVSANGLQLIVNSEKQATNNLQLSFTSSNFSNINALQTTLHFDNNKYEFVAIESNKLQIDYNATKANTTGNIAVLWTDKNAEAKSFDKDEVLFTIVLKPLTSANQLSAEIALSINNDIAETEVWDNNFTKRNIILTQRVVNDKPQTPNNLLVYPNPAHTNVFVKVNKLEGSNKLLVTDCFGKIIKEQSLIKGINIIDVSMFSKGIYMITVTAEHSKQIQKIVIE